MPQKRWDEDPEHESGDVRRLDQQVKGHEHLVQQKGSHDPAEQCGK